MIGHFFYLEIFWYKRKYFMNKQRFLFFNIKLIKKLKKYINIIECINIL